MVKVNSNLRRLFWFLFNERGAVGADGKEVADSAAEKMIPQSQVNEIVKERLARDRQNFADYEDLKKFKSEHEKQLDVAKQKELEAAKEYEKLKEGWTKKEQELQGIVSRKDSEISDMKIGNALIGEINKQNAYAEETMALLKSSAVFDKEGNIRIKGRDANGLEVFTSVEEGVKKFLEGRPHLIRATKKDGGGTGGGKGIGQDNAGVEDLNTLNAELLEAQRVRDYKKAGELTKKVRAKLTSQGVRS